MPVERAAAGGHGLGRGLEFQRRHGGILQEAGRSRNLEFIEPSVVLVTGQLAAPATNWRETDLPGLPINGIANRRQRIQRFMAPPAAPS